MTRALVERATILGAAEVAGPLPESLRDLADALRAALRAEHGPPR